MIEALFKASGEKKNLQSVVMGHFHFVARASKQLVIMRNRKLVPLLLKHAHGDYLHGHFAFWTKTCGSFSI